MRRGQEGPKASGATGPQLALRSTSPSARPEDPLKTPGVGTRGKGDGGRDFSTDFVTKAPDTVSGTQLEHNVCSSLPPPSYLFIPGDT